MQTRSIPKPISSIETRVLPLPHRIRTSYLIQYNYLVVRTGRQPRNLLQSKGDRGNKAIRCSVVESRSSCQTFLELSDQRNATTASYSEEMSIVVRHWPGNLVNVPDCFNEAHYLSQPADRTAICRSIAWRLNHKPLGNPIGKGQCSRSGRDVQGGAAPVGGSESRASRPEGRNHECLRTVPPHGFAQNGFAYSAFRLPSHELRTTNCTTSRLKKTRSELYRSKEHTPK